MNGVQMRKYAYQLFRGAARTPRDRQDARLASCDFTCGIRQCAHQRRRHDYRAVSVRMDEVTLIDPQSEHLDFAANGRRPGVRVRCG